MSRDVLSSAEDTPCAHVSDEVYIVPRSQMLLARSIHGASLCEAAFTILSDWPPSPLQLAISSGSFGSINKLHIYSTSSPLRLQNLLPLRLKHLHSTSIRWMGFQLLEMLADPMQLL